MIFSTKQSEIFSWKSEFLADVYDQAVNEFPSLDQLVEEKGGKYAISNDNTRFNEILEERLALKALCERVASRDVLAEQIGYFDPLGMLERFRTLLADDSLTTRIQLSAMPMGSLILPHVDSGRKVCTFLVPLTLNDKPGWDTIFYPARRSGCVGIRNPRNRELNIHEPDAVILRNEYIKSKLSFAPQIISGFVRTDESWHEVLQLTGEKGEIRRSINVQLIRNK